MTDEGCHGRTYEILEYLATNLTSINKQDDYKGDSRGVPFPGGSWCRGSWMLTGRFSSPLSHRLRSRHRGQ